jgi:hypothetical protein
MVETVNSRFTVDVWIIWVRGYVDDVDVGWGGGTTTLKLSGLLHGVSLNWAPVHHQKQRKGSVTLFPRGIQSTVVEVVSHRGLGVL